jgi:monoamine oxidase
MGRTYLFSRLERALQLAAYCEATGLATAEGLERVAEARWSRRRFLVTMAVATAGTALGTITPPRLARGAASPRIVIVGAGCAGLTCAYRLQQAGIEARVLEAGKRVGGRMLSLREGFPGGRITELGGEFLDSDHTSLLRLVQELDLSLTDVREADGDLESEVFYFAQRRVPFTEVVESFRPVAARMRADLATLTGDGSVTYRHPNNGAALDKLSIAEWLETRGVTGVIRALLEVAYVAEYGLDADAQSALNLLLLIEPEPEHFKLYGKSDERFRITAGNDSVPTRLAARLQRPIEFEARLEAIRQRHGGTYVLTVNQAGTVRDIEADRIVLTLPFTMLRHVDLRVELPPQKRLAIDTLGYGTGAKVLAGFSQRVWRAAGSNGSTYADLAYQCAWEPSRDYPGAHGVLTNLSGGSRGLAVGKGTPEAQAADFVHQIDAVFPGTAVAYTGRAVRFHWPSAPFVQGSYACYRPGQYTTIAGVEREAVGGLHFAGEHTSLDFQGFMNGACESGERAAQEVLASVYGKKRSLLPAYHVRVSRIPAATTRPEARVNIATR